MFLLLQLNLMNDLVVFCIGFGSDSQSKSLVRYRGVALKSF